MSPDPAALPPDAAPAVHVDRVVVGGGFSGALAALEAHAAGESVVVLEASDRGGGALWGCEIDGVTVDAGAESFSVVSPEMAALLGAWGLGSEIVSPEPAPPRIVLAHSSVPVPRGVMGIPAGLDTLEQSGLCDDAELAEVARKDADAIPDWTGWSVSDVVVSRLGQSVLDRLVAPVIYGVFGTHPDALEADAVFPELLAAAQACGSLLEAAAAVRAGGAVMGQAVQSVRGGLHRVAGVMEDLLADRGIPVHLSSPVTGITSVAGGYLINGPSSFMAPRVSIAVGPAALKSLLAGQDELLPALEALEPVKSRVAIVSVEHEQLNGFPIGSGALIADEVGVGVKALTHVNAKWGWWGEILPPNRHIIRMSLHQELPWAPLTGDDSVSGADAERDVVLDALSRVLAVPQDAVREMVFHSWSDVLMRPRPGFSQKMASLKAQAAARGIDIKSGVGSGNGLLRIAKSFSINTTQEVHRV